jgi:hypothetical protein
VGDSVAARWRGVVKAWLAFSARRAFVRHPVGVARERIGRVILAALVVGSCIYLYQTTDEAIRRRATDFLTQATSGEVRIGRAQFRMFSGITLHDVRVSVPYSSQLDRTAKDARSREIFSASSLTLIHNPWLLLLGKLRVEQIVAARPTITLVQNVDTGMRNWHLLAARARSRRDGKSTTIPNITIRSARAIVRSVRNDGSRESRIEELDADVRPNPRSMAGYCIEIRRFSDPPERSTVVFDPTARLVSNVPFVDAKTVRLQLPKEAQQFFDEIKLEGQVKLGRYSYQTTRPSEYLTEIELRNVKCEVPMALLQTEGASRSPVDSKPGKGRPGEEEVIMTGVHGLVQLRGSRLEIDVEGVVNDAACSLKGRLEGVDRPLAQIGFDMHVQAAQFVSPEGALRRRVLQDPNLPTTLRSIFEDYDPHGKFDIDFRVRRDAGEHGGISLTGSLSPKAARGRCRWFDYPVSDLSGSVIFDEQGVRIVGLSGRHGASTVRLDGRIDRRTYWSDVEIDVVARDVALDADLFTQLSEHHKSIWKRFDPHGSAQLAVKLRRPATAKGEPDPVWVTRVEADLVDSGVVLAEFAYPLTGVCGKLLLDGDRMEFHDLVGKHDGAEIKIDGNASFSASSPPEVQLKIGARAVKMDEALLKALPAEGRGAVSQFQPDGVIDLDGSVSYDAASGLTYDLAAKIRDSSIVYREFPYRIDHVSGEFRIKPDHVLVMDVSGVHGASKIRACGEVRAAPTGFVADLTFECRKLVLDEDLRKALTPSLQDVWRLFSPQGTVSVLTDLHHVSESGQATQRHRTQVEAADVSMRFAPLPFALSAVRGKALLTDDRVDIAGLFGRIGPGTIVLSGGIDLKPPGRRGALKVEAKGMTFDANLLAALPEGLRAGLGSVEPTGDFDITLDPLQFDLDEAGRGGWRFAGGMTLRNSSANLGFELRGASGALTGEGQVDAAGRVGVALRAELERASFAGWPLDAFAAHLDKRVDEPIVVLRDATAKLYGGDASGFGKMRLRGLHSEYELSILARDLSLGRYLASPQAAAVTTSAPTTSAAEESSPMASAKGSIDGNLAMRGRTGEQGYREGAGELRVRGAQVWKLPLLFAVFQVLNFTPDENVFHDGWMKYYLTQDTLTIEQVDLQGRALSLLGSGKMTLPGKELDVTLLARSPMRIHVPLLTELLEGASRELMEVHVTGTLNKPNIRPKPLRSLGNALKLLFPKKPGG